MVFNDASKDRDTKNRKFPQENGVRNAECSGSEYTENDTVYTLPCEIVRDLLPSYAEGLTSDVTVKSIEYHIKDCSSCSAALDAMQANDISIDDCATEPSDICAGVGITKAENEQHEEAREIDYLKKVRKRFIAGITICIAAAIVALCGLWAVQYRFNTFSMHTANIESVTDSVSVENTTLEFSGNVKENGRAITGINFVYNEGVVNISAKITKKFPWNSGDFDEIFSAPGDIRQVWIAGQLVWENGKAVPENVGRLYSSKNKYVGDISGDGKVAEALDIFTHSGSWTNELQTSTEPYGWTLKLQTPVNNYAPTITHYEEQMRRDAYMLIALIDNLGYVSWEYNIDGEDKTKMLTVTQDEATHALGSDIKKCAETAESLQDAMEKLGIY